MLQRFVQLIFEVRDIFMYIYRYNVREYALYIMCSDFNNYKIPFDGL
jgi:hypothetical protein